MPSTKNFICSLNAGGRVRPDGKTEDQWRTLLNQARDTLKDAEKRKHMPLRCVSAHRIFFYGRVS